MAKSKAIEEINKEIEALNNGQYLDDALILSPPIMVDDVSLSNNEEIFESQEAPVIEYCSADLLNEHERQSEIYGITLVDDDFVESIRVKGIIQPVLVSKRIDGKYYIIAGHRRVKGSVKAGFTGIPCIIKKYDNIDDEVADLVISNKQREKTTSQKKQEYFVWNQILCQIKQVRKQLATCTDEEIEKLDFRTGVRKYEELLDTKNLDSRKALAELMNISERELNYLHGVYSDDYMNKQVALINTKLDENGVNLKVAEATVKGLYRLFQEVRVRCDNEKLTLKEGYDLIRAELKTASEIKSKDSKPAQIKEPEVIPESKPAFNAKKLLVKMKDVSEPVTIVSAQNNMTFLFTENKVYLTRSPENSDYYEINTSELEKLI